MSEALHTSGGTSVLFSTAMRRAGAPMELHIYAKEPHGDGMSPALGPISEWPRLCELWMRANGWLPASPLTGGKSP